jgi:ATP-binding cassette subfamily B (MDR/TAP) protein 1
VGQAANLNGASQKAEHSNGCVVSGGHGTVIATAFAHMRTVSAFSLQHKVSAHYAALTRAIAADRTQRFILGGIAYGVSQAAPFFTYALLFWYGSQLIEKGELTVVQVLSAIMCLMIGALGLGDALRGWGDQQLGIQAAHRMFGIIDEGATSPIDGLSATGQQPQERAQGRLVLTKVDFCYPTRPDVQVCKHLSLTIEPGETVAFVGPSGSGKSTIINLLLRFYDPLSGTVTLDDVDIKDLNVRWLRSQVGYVGQEPVLFSGTVAENIAKGRVDPLNQPASSPAEAMRSADNARTGRRDDCCAAYMCASQYGAVQPSACDAEMDVEIGPLGEDQDILEAAIASNANDFIRSFPKGYDTEVGGGSSMVSGGQKQRIAIARALIKKPAVLLLDEATSALDAASERVVQESIDALQRMKAQTTIVIAHRLSTVRNADKIVVIDHGAIVEIGKHEALVAQRGLYASLWAGQSNGYTTPTGHKSPTSNTDGGAR